MSEEKATIYNVEVNGEQRKAIDLIALKTFLQGNRYQFSILSLDLEKTDLKTPVSELVARACQATLQELEQSIDAALGLIKPEEDSTPEEADESPIEDNPQVSFPDEPESKSDEDEEKIIL